jgi:antitoxin VapB
MSATNTKPPSQIQSESQSAAPRTAKLFKNGRSQAVRLPKEFRFEGTEVAIRRDPATGEVVLSQPSAHETRSWQEWFELLDSLDIPDGTFEREVHMPTERDIF